MPLITTLPGVAATRIAAPYVQNPRQALCGLTMARACAGVGPNGALAVWLDDAGLYRSKFCRDRKTLDLQTFTTPQQLGDWLDAWWPKLN